jgi:hypothetical protein
LAATSFNAVGDSRRVVPLAAFHPYFGDGIRPTACLEG